MEQVRYFEDVKIILKELEETKKDVKNMSIDELNKELEVRRSLVIFTTPTWAYWDESDVERSKAKNSNEWRINDIKRQLKIK